MHKKKGKMAFGMDTSEQPHQAEQFRSKKKIIKAGEEEEK